MELSLHGLGGGSLRYAELEYPSLEYTYLHANTLYYESDCIKVFSHKTESNKKLNDHKLPPEIARCYLIYSHIIRAIIPANTKLLPCIKGELLYFMSLFVHYYLHL